MMDLNKLKGSVITIGGANIIVVDAVLGTETIKVSGDNGKTYLISVLIKNGTIVLDDSVKAEVIKCIDELVAAAKEEKEARKKAEAEAAKKEPPLDGGECVLTADTVLQVMNT